MFLSDDDAKRMLDKFGVERFLYGTDFPMWTPKTEIQRFLDKPLGLSQQEKEDVLYNNFARLFSLA
jgi:predicted TIM-barrel fold metal-dependent hydrolase